MMTKTESMLTVSQLNRRVRHWLEHDIGPICVQGEVSSLSKPASGHCYFSLKDASAQLRCVFFKNRHRANTTALLEHGKQLVLRGTLSVYEARGDYQLIVESLEAAGLGDLAAQFEALKAKLLAQGLFNPALKKTWPTYPSTIGLITSPTGAAIRDMLSTLARRFPLATILIYPSDVQGAQAVPQLIQAIQRANKDARCDVLLLARGGGSLEDLWAFNDEKLAYTIAQSTLPIVSGVGHETDFTIADFVADHRAATPTAAAEAVTPSQEHLKEHCTRLNQRLMLAITRLIKQQTERLKHISERLRSPQHALQSHAQTLDYLTRQLHQAMQTHLLEKKHALEQQAYALQALSPLATLARGYAVASLDGNVIRKPSDAPIGVSLTLQVAKGTLTCEVTDHA